MAQLMKQTIVFGAGLAGLAALTQTASADTEAKPLTLEEVKAENAKRLATYETEKREIDARNIVTHMLSTLNLQNVVVQNLRNLSMKHCQHLNSWKNQSNYHLM